MELTVQLLAELVTVVTVIAACVGIRANLRKMRSAEVEKGEMRAKTEMAVSMRLDHIDEKLEKIEQKLDAQDQIHRTVAEHGVEISALKDQMSALRKKGD